MPRLLDLFCGAGGAAMGYHRAGFDVVGVDHVPQPRYPFAFHQGDATTWPLDGFDAVHASPPCHDHSALRHRTGADHATGWMLDATVARLAALAVPWVVENVEGPDVTMAGWWFRLCGSSFGLGVRRHRRFGSNVLILAPGCRHADQGQPIGVYGNSGPWDGGRGRKGDVAESHAAMGIEWMNRREISQAIPPAYTEFIGTALLAALPPANQTSAVLVPRAPIASLRTQRDARFPKELPPCS